MLAAVWHTLQGRCAAPIQSGTRWRSARSCSQSGCPKPGPRHRHETEETECFRRLSSHQSSQHRRRNRRRGKGWHRGLALLLCVTRATENGPAFCECFVCTHTHKTQRCAGPLAAAFTSASWPSVRSASAEPWRSPWPAADSILPASTMRSHVSGHMLAVTC